MRPSARLLRHLVPAVLFTAGALTGWLLTAGSPAPVSDANPSGGPGRNRGAARLRAAREGPLGSLGRGTAAQDVHRVVLELARADAGSMAGLFAEFDSRAPTPLDRLLWLSLAWQRWVELDAPAAMLALHGRNDLRPDEFDEFVRMAARSALNDAPAMLRAAAALPASGRRDRWVKLCAEAAMEQHHLPVEDILAALPDDPPGLRLSVEGSRMADRISKEPDAVEAWLAAHPEFSGAKDLTARIYRARAETDPAGALTKAQALASPLLRLEAARTVMDAWADKDPAAALAAAKSLPPSALRSYALGRAAAETAPNDPDAALALLPGITSRDDRLRVWEALPGGMFARDPVRAMDLLERDTPREAQAAAGAALMDRYTALAWEPGHAPFPAHVQERVRQLAAEDPVLAQKLATSWSSYEPAAALEWAADLPSTAGAGALDAAAARLASDNRDLAAARISDIREPQRRAIALAAALRTVDGDTVAWSAQFPSDDLLRARRILRHGSTALAGNVP